MQKSSYSEISSPPGSVDWESESPVLVGQPHPRCTTQDEPLPSVDQHKAPVLENSTGAQTEGLGSVQNISDADREPEKLELTSDYQHHEDLVPPAPGIPPCSIPFMEHRLPPFQPFPFRAKIEDGVTAVSVPAPSASPEVVVPNVPHTSSGGEHLAIHPALSEFIRPSSPPPPIVLSNTAIQGSRRSHFSVVSESASSPPQSPNSNVSDVIPPRLISPSSIGKCFCNSSGPQRRGLI